MSEASEFFRLSQQAFEKTVPSDVVTFEHTDECYTVVLSDNTYIAWSSDNEFMHGTSCWISFREFLQDAINTSTIHGTRWLKLFKAYPGVREVCWAIVDSSSTDELRLRLSVAGLI